MHKRVGEVGTMLNATVSELSLNKHKIFAKVYNLSFLKHRFIHLTIFTAAARRALVVIMSKCLSVILSFCLVTFSRPLIG